MTTVDWSHCTVRCSIGQIETFDLSPADTLQLYAFLGALQLQ